MAHPARASRVSVADSLSLWTAGGRQEVRLIIEGDVYLLIFGTKLPESQAFMAWVAEEVKPALKNRESIDRCAEPPQAVPLLYTVVPAVLNFVCITVSFLIAFAVRFWYTR